MKNFCLEEKSLVYKVVKERYFWEHERKNELNNSISIPVGIISVLIGCIAYFFNNEPQVSNLLLFVLYWIFIFLSIVCLFFCLFCFFFHQTGYTYCYISSPDKLYEYEKNYIENFQKNNVKVDYEIINSKVSEFLYKQYVDASTKNKENNERKVKFYRYLIISLTMCIIFLGASFYCRINLESQEIPSTRIEVISPVDIEISKEVKIKNITDENNLDNISIKENEIKLLPKEEKMAENEETEKQPKMSASQVPAPEPPKMEMLTESYNPFDFTKEQIKNFSNNKKEK